MRFGIGDRLLPGSGGAIVDRRHDVIDEAAEAMSPAVVIDDGGMDVVSVDTKRTTGSGPVTVETRKPAPQKAASPPPK